MEIEQEDWCKVNLLSAIVSLYRSVLRPCLPRDLLSPKDSMFQFLVAEQRELGQELLHDHPHTYVANPAASQNCSDYT
jgi:hypothetical protein